LLEFEPNAKAAQDYVAAFQRIIELIEVPAYGVVQEKATA
jgi:hypothetical protein